MKNRYSIYIIALAVALCSISCTTQEPYGKNTTRRDIAYLWSLARHGSVAIREDISVRGMVVANDKFNEVTKSIIVADMSGGIEVAIDSYNTESIAPLFSHVELNISGLHIGRQGIKCILGAPPTGEYVVDRIAERDISKYIRPCDNDDTIRAKQMSIAEIDRSYLLHYVYVDGVRFIDEERSAKWCDRDTTGNYIESIRHLTDGKDTLRVVCSAECNYAATDIPKGMVSLYGVIDYAKQDIALRITHYQALSPAHR